MEKNIIIDAIVEKTNTDINNARLLADDLMNLHAPFDKYLERWINDSSDIVEDCRIIDISVSALMNDGGLTYPAALSTLNWILCEGVKAYDYVMSAL